MGVTSGSLDSPNGIDSGKTTMDKALKNGHDKENNSSNSSVVKSEAEGDANSVITPKDTIEIGANINVSYKSGMPVRIQACTSTVLLYVLIFLPILGS